jgi:hypothetical protein
MEYTILFHCHRETNKEASRRYPLKSVVGCDCPEGWDGNDGDELIFIRFGPSGRKRYRGNIARLKNGAPLKMIGGRVNKLRPKRDGIEELSGRACRDRHDMQIENFRIGLFSVQGFEGTWICKTRHEVENRNFWLDQFWLKLVVNKGNIAVALISLLTSEE